MFPSVPVSRIIPSGFGHNVPVMMSGRGSNITFPAIVAAMHMEP